MASFLRLKKAVPLRCLLFIKHYQTGSSESRILLKLLKLRVFDKHTTIEVIKRHYIYCVTFRELAGQTWSTESIALDRNDKYNSNTYNTLNLLFYSNTQ